MSSLLMKALDRLSRIRPRQDLDTIWLIAVAAAAIGLGAAGYRTLIDGVRQSSLLSGFACLCTLLAFAIGDLGVIRVTRAAHVDCHLPGARLWDVLLVVLHGFTLNALALVCIGDPIGFVIGLMFLFAINEIWLALKLMELDRLIDTANSREIAARMRECRRAIQKWMLLNGGYAVLVTGLLQLSRLWNWSIELNAVCLGLTIVRGLADFGLCHVYYEAVLGGDYRREKLA
ncbi:MAG: hypothetical protein KDE27_11125 [Planctomycetes bacterium]|nr:hypothetical protein [Planctomycetota bacterium]